MENHDLGPKEDDPIWQSNNPPEPEEPEDCCNQCGKPSEHLIERGRRLICQACDEDNAMDAAEVQHAEE